MQKYKSTETEILVRKAGRENEKWTRMCRKEAQGGSGGPEKEARLIRSGRANLRRNWSKGNLTICPLPEWMKNSLRTPGSIPRHRRESELLAGEVGGGIDETTEPAGH